VGIVESAFRSRSFPDPNFSEQQLIDCATPNGSGCEGGLIESGLIYIQAHGVTFEDLYPYENTRLRMPCRQEIQGVFKLKTWKKILRKCAALIEYIK
jgi:hypothetical protein